MKKILFFLLSGLSILACKTDIVSRIDDRELVNGAYMRTVSPYPAGNTTFAVSTTNLSGSKLELVAEAVTVNKGALFQSYDLSIAFVDQTPANGNKSVAAVALKSLPASSFTADATTGYPRATISITGTEALAAVKLTAADITATTNIATTDYFTVTAVMKLTDGRSFSTANTPSLDITSGAFYSSPFAYRINVR